MNKQLRAKRSDSIIDNIRPQVINLLFSTSLSYAEIGKIVECSRGPISEIYALCKARGRVRRNIKRTGKIRLCYYCGVEFYSAPGKSKRGRQKFCSKQCYTAWQKTEDNRGKNNPNWIDGGKHETELNRARKSEEWRAWREYVFQRDNYTCQLCGERGLEMHPHHILQKCDYPDLIFEVDNGITLCKDCHRSKGVHSYKSIFVGLFRMLVNKNNEALLIHR